MGEKSMHRVELEKPYSTQEAIWHIGWEKYKTVLATAVVGSELLHTLTHVPKGVEQMFDAMHTLRSAAGAGSLIPSIVRMARSIDNALFNPCDDTTTKTKEVAWNAFRFFGDAAQSVISVNKMYALPIEKAVPGLQVLAAVVHTTCSYQNISEILQKAETSDNEKAIAVAKELSQVAIGILGVTGLIVSSPAISGGVLAFSVAWIVLDIVEYIPEIEFMFTPRTPPATVQ